MREDHVGLAQQDKPVFLTGFYSEGNVKLPKERLC